MKPTPAADRRFRAPADEGTPAAAAAAPAPDAGNPPAAAPAAAPPAADPATPAAPAAKWWEKLPEQQRAYLTPKGLTTDDPMEALPRLIEIAAHAEKRIGKGLDSIIEKPAKGQSYADWARANAEALGLPAEAAAYEVKPPADWPKDLPWNAEGEAKARELAFKYGIPREAHEAYIGLQAQMVREMDEAATKGIAEAREAMMTDLRRDWGTQTDAKLTQARQAMQYLAEQAGIGNDGIEALAATLSAKTGDAGVMRIFAKVAELMAEDTGFAVGRGQQSFGMTPAEARAEIARFEAPDGPYGKAFANNDMRQLAALKAKRDELYKIAAGG